MHQQNYDYDALNRLTWVSEYLNAATNTGSQHYLYDRWGNRRINPISWGAGINNKQFEVTAANNRLGVPVGQSGTMTYDPAGNLINDTYTGAGSRDYDAENKMTKAWGWNNQWQEYTYNADGQRVRRKVNGVETWQIYGFDGELLAEYAVNAAPTSPRKEYGYRNGELLITAASTQACGVGYSGSKTWTATNPSLGHATGQQEGSNWAVYVGSHSPTAMVFGPYDSTFGQGQHSAQFWLMVDNNSGTDVVATVDAVTNYGGNNLAQRLIRRNEFVAANQWQVFTLEFENPCFGLVESRVWWSGTVNMNLKWSNEICDSEPSFGWMVVEYEAPSFDQGHRQKRLGSYHVHFDETKYFSPFVVDLSKCPATSPDALIKLVRYGQNIKFAENLFKGLAATIEPQHQVLVTEGDRVNPLNFHMVYHNQVSGYLFDAQKILQLHNYGGGYFYEGRAGDYDGPYSSFDKSGVSYSDRIRSSDRADKLEQELDFYSTVLGDNWNVYLEHDEILEIITSFDGIEAESIREGVYTMSPNFIFGYLDELYLKILAALTSYTTNKTRKLF